MSLDVRIVMFTRRTLLAGFAKIRRRPVPRVQNYSSFTARIGKSGILSFNLGSIYLI